eukprot:XP_020406175.1 uncharacterized protein LOC103651580 isoform X3 [Zea mays]
MKMRSSVPSRETMKMFMMCRKQLQNQMIFFPSRQGKHGDVGKNMPTNTNVTPQATPHTESCSPIFDATPQIKSPGGVQQAAETDLPDNGPCFDQTPSEHVSVETDPATNTPQVDQISLDSEMQTVLALREYLCDTQSDTSSHYSTLRNRNDIVGTLNLLMNLYCTLLDNALPETDEMDKCKAIMVPMVSRGHWTLYVVNTVKKCIHILDSNPYGATLGGTTWKEYHFAQLDLGGRKLP